MKIGPLIFVISCVWFGARFNTQGADAVVPIHLPNGQFVREWLVLGPFLSRDLNTDFLSTSGGELNVRPKQGDTVEGPNGGGLTWKSHAAAGPSVSFSEALGSYQQSTAYAYCEFESDGEADIAFEFIARYEAKVWVNGEPVVLARRSAMSPELQSAAVTLRKGKNACLVKVSHTWNNWEFALRLLPRERAVLQGKIIAPTESHLDGTLIELFRGDERVAQTRADKEGRYRFDIFPAAGTYDLAASLNRSGAWRLGLNLRESDRQSIDLRLEEAVSISGAVLTMDLKTPQTTVPVQVVRLGANGVDERVMATEFTDEKGEYKFIALKPGRYRVRCQTPNGHVYYRSPNRPDGTESADLIVGNGPLRRIDFVLPEIKKGIWKSYSTYDGLPYQSVASIQLMRNGLMHLGLLNGGLCEFDGAEFRQVPSLEGLSGNYINALDRDRDDGLWMAAGDDGLIWYDGRQSRAFTSTNGLVSNHTTTVRVDRENNVWIGTRHGLSKFTPGKAFVNYRIQEGLAGNTVFDIFQASDGAMWFGTSGGVCRFEGGRFDKIDLQPGARDPIVLSVYESSDGAMWFGTDNGVVRYRDGRLDRLTMRDGLVGNRVVDILETRDRNLWLATDRGLSRFNGTGFVNYTKLDGLVFNLISQLHLGPDGVLWIATNDGLCRFDPSGFVQWSERDGLLNQERRLSAVVCLKAVPNDGIWIGTGDGIFRFDGTRISQTPPFAALGDVSDIHGAFDGTIWIASRGLWKYEAGQLEKVLEDQRIYKMSSDSTGHLWFGTPGEEGRLWRYRIKTGELREMTPADGLPHHGGIWSIQRGRGDDVWIGSFAGLFMFDGQKFVDVDDRRAPEDLEGAAVWGIHVDLDGTVWFAGSSLIARYDRRKFAFLDENLRLRSPKVWDITRNVEPRSPNQVVWMATGNYGLIGYDGTAFTTIDTRDGLAGKNAKAVVVDPQGDVWVGTRDGGLTRYRRGEQRPTVQVVSVKIDEDVSSNVARKLELQTGHRVTITCRSIDFKTLPQKRQFLYEWKTADGAVITNTVSTERQVDWTPRKGGSYVFQVSAIDRDLRYSSPQQLHFKVTPPWYLNAWIAVPAGGSIGGLFLFAVVTGWRYIVHRRAAERLQEHMLRQERQARGSLQESNRRLEEAKQSAEEARETAEEAKQASELASRAKSIFLANMSHEIRTPLNAILGYAQILQRNGKLQENQRQAISTIERSGNHLLSLINEILDLSKIESGRMELSVADFDLRELILGIGLMFEPRCQQKGLKWKISGVGDAPIPVRGDEGKLRQVLINLVGNAVKFTDRGHVTLRMERRDDDLYSFHVVDSGPGIAPNMQKKILEPFTQGAEGKHKGGTGLGLAISRRHVELMGGELRLESELGAGSRFYFSLHLPPAKGEVVSKVREEEKPVRHLKEGSRVRVLVVDDVVENRDVLEQFLVEIGAEVEVAVDGEEGWAKLRDRSYDIAFLDIQMPGLTGTEVAERVLREFGTGKVKLVAISASVLKHEQTQYSEKGFDGFVPKPFRFEQICECLSGLLGAEFEYEDEHQESAVDTAPRDFPKIEWPPELLQRLRRAAETYSVTEFDAYLGEVEALGDGGRQIAQRLRDLSRNIQFDEILTILNNGQLTS